jgi:general secretion pathway protein E
VVDRGMGAKVICHRPGVPDTTPQVHGTWSMQHEQRSRQAVHMDLAIRGRLQPESVMANENSLLDAFKIAFSLTDAQTHEVRDALLTYNLPPLTAFEPLGITDENRILQTMSDYLGLPLLRREDYPEKPVILEGVSMLFLRKHAVMPVQMDGGQVTVVVNNPLNIPLLNILENYFAGLEIKICLGQQEEILNALDRLYGTAAREAEALSREGNGGPQGLEGFEDDLEHLKGLAQEAPIIRLVNVTISRALDMRASDIHFEPFERSFKIRYRVDGVLYDLDQHPKSMQPAIISRLKLMANLNIAERRLPQDGRIKIKFGSRQTDIRVSTAPTIYGESVVLRLLAQETADYQLNKLGMSDGQLTMVEDLIERPFGIILVTGPTGSGKTTTLYAVLKKINTATKKIITVEDPVEYQIDGINQIQVKPQIDLTFANALRSLVRQDPDVLLIGEIRDKETADIAIESALTGHLVLSTLHTNDAPGAITRLRDLGIESFLMADSMLAVLAQRLIRVLCPFCKEAHDARDVDRTRLADAFPQLPEQLVLYQTRGCDKCGYTGFKGRQAIFEVLPLSDPVRSAIVADKSAGEIAQLARRESYRPLLQHGYQKVLDGVTTLSEVLRVTSLF